MKYKLRGSAEHLNQLWKQTHLSDLINLTQFGSLWIKRLPDWFAMLQFLTNTVCIGEELLACSTRGNALFNLLKWVHLSCFLLQDSVVIAELKKKEKKSQSCVNFQSFFCDVRELMFSGCLAKGSDTWNNSKWEYVNISKSVSASNPGPSRDPESHIFFTSRWIWVTWAAGWSTHTQRAGRLHDLYLLTAPSCYNCQSQS